MRKSGFMLMIPGLAINLVALSLVLLVSGCGKPPIPVQRYILDYSPPVVGARTKNPESLTVERFGVAQTFNTTDMVYQSGPYRSDSYSYSRWRVNPGSLVTDYLARDLRNSRLFQGVFVAPTEVNSRYRLEGRIEEFAELDEPDGWKAALTLNVTLLDTIQEEVPKKVVFQKKYRGVGLMPAKSPQGLAQGMSRAMEEVSARIITDIYQACQKRSGVPGKYGQERP